MSICIGGSSQDIWSLALKAIREQKEAEEEEEAPESLADGIVSGNDKDGDGLLSVDEMGVSEDEFAALDTDGDDLVSTDELETGLAKAAEDLLDLSDPATGFARQIMALFDADGDSMLNLEESGLSEEAFAQADADGDGLLSAEEIAQGTPAGDEAEAPDAVLTRSDSGLPASNFNEIDTDGDGVISQSELMQWLRKSQTNLAEIMNEESDNASGVSGLFTLSLKAYRNQMDSIMGTLTGTEEGLQALLDSDLYNGSLDLSI